MTPRKELKIEISNIEAEIDGVTDKEYQLTLINQLSKLFEELNDLDGDCIDPENCGTSTGICEGLTFGTGKLDFNGYWEFPCWSCARKHEVSHPEAGACWPYDLGE